MEVALIVSRSGEPASLAFVVFIGTAAATDLIGKIVVDPAIVAAVSVVVVFDPVDVVVVVIPDGTSVLCSRRARNASRSLCGAQPIG